MDLLIVGASARAAAFSALRVGLRPTSLDLFADLDLTVACPALKINPADYPDAAAGLASDLPPMPWLYTGALENRPDLVEQISSCHRLLGNDAPTLRKAREPGTLFEATLEAGLLPIPVLDDPSQVPVDGSWLVKPLASAGGRGIRHWVGMDSKIRGPAYYQERAVGLPLSALYVGDGSTARCLGITRQYLGRGRNRFAYRGSLGPWPVSPIVQARLERLGAAIAARAALIGLFGVDFVLDGDQPRPVEVNPRYTASVEVLEWSLGHSLLAEHLRSTGLEGDFAERWSAAKSFVAKAIVTADRACRWPSEASPRKIDPAAFPEIADIPQPGTALRPGNPVLTVFARADTLERCLRTLAARISEWRGRLRLLRDR